MAFINENKDTVDLSGRIKSGGVELLGQEKRGSDQLFYAETKGITKWIIHLSGGVIKNPKQAEYAMIGLIAVGIAVTLLIVFGGNGKQEFFMPAAEAPVEEVIPPAEF